MAERFKAPVLKTGDPQGSVGSNPTPSAMLNPRFNWNHTLSRLIKFAISLFPLEWRPQWQATDGAGDIPIG
jgi:hypothetical protein